MFGLLVNGFPFYDFHHLRIPGILQRIALCYAISALLYLAMSSPAGEDPTLATDAQSRSTRTAGELATVIAVILIGYWVLLRYFAVPGFGPARYDSLGYLGAYIDRAVFTTRHLWAWVSLPDTASPTTPRACSRPCPPSPTPCSASSPACGSACRAPGPQ